VVVFGNALHVEIEFCVITNLRQVENFAFVFLAGRDSARLSENVWDLASLIVEPQVAQVGSSVLPYFRIEDDVVLTGGIRDLDVAKSCEVTKVSVGNGSDYCCGQEWE
jgi:hypothetical protein